VKGARWNINEMTARPIWITTVAVLLCLFGILSILSGSRALFGDAEAQAAVGNAVQFVLWFNFLAGFLYVLAGIGLYCRKRWAVRLSIAIALATVLVFAAFGWYVASGHPFEIRTVAAMVLRSGVWIVVAVAAYRAL
jgi:hypothetical protein